jgi:eukaryotic-like serine/threonine-protein kinase
MANHDPTGSEPTIDTPSSPAAAETVAGPLREGPGTRIGPYKLLQLIGEGGFGSVFMAEQEKPVSRKVALKIIKLGMDTRQVVARFEQERQALAILDHPNIAKVFDAGATETGRPYFVMELVKGDPIVEYCDKNNLSIQDRLELFAQVCNAVQHAHTKGIIHRDIKPSNILVSMQDGRPHTKVIDFGIAKATSSKLTEKTLFTEHRQLIGTPEYMSPEQAEGSLDIDTRTDVYSLGVLLYELLTGTTPFSGKELRSAAYAEIQRIIREVEPPKPSTRLSANTDTIAGVAAKRHTEPKRLGTIVRGELDWIVMKALEKDRQRRYETANGLAMDVRRYLSGEAVVAAPPNASYRFKKFIRRNRVMVTAGSAVAFALLIGIVAFAWQAKVARDQRDLAVVAQEAEAEQRALAVTAVAETKKRADQLKQVSEFQAKMLKDIDPAQTGEKLVEDIRARFDAALAKANVPEAQRTARSVTFAKELDEVNSTDTAVEMIDRTILKPAIAAVDAQFKDQPVVDASLRHTLAELYKNIGQFGVAASLQEKALETRRSVVGEDDRDTMTALNNLGAILEAKGDMVKAEACYREALANRRRVLGENDLDTLTSMSNVGNFLREQGKFGEAEPLLRSALDGQRKVLGPKHRETLISTNTYGFLLIAQGKATEAEPYWREAYETGKRKFGPDDPDVLVWTNNMGGLLGSLGRHADSAPLYREAMDGARRVHGLEHPNTLTCMTSYASALMNLGRYAEAEALMREALAARRKTIGPDHPDTLQSMSNLGSLLRDQAKFDEAELILRDSMERRERTLGKEHPSSLVAVAMLGRLYSDQGKYAQAEAAYREMLDRSKNVWGEDHPERLICYSNLGGVLVLEEKFAEAEVCIRKSLEARLRVSGPDHPETLNSMSQMARLLEKQGKTEEAEPMYRDALERIRRVRGDDHPGTLNAITNMGEILRVRGKLAEAEPLLREVNERTERVFGKDHARMSGTHLSLGRLFVAMNQYVQAEKELLEVQRVNAIAKGVLPTRRVQSLQSLAELYEAWNKAESGKGYDAKAAEWKEKLRVAKAMMENVSSQPATSPPSVTH